MRIDVVGHGLCGPMAAGIVADCLLIRASPLRPGAAVVGALILTAVLVIGAPSLIRSRFLGILDLRT